MSPAVQMFAVAAVVFLMVGSGVSALVVRVSGDRVLKMDPRSRHRAIMMLAALPLLVAGTLLFSALLPSLVSLVVPSVDHCLVHEDGHAHLCFVHLPTTGIHFTLALTLVFVATYGVVRFGLAVYDLRRAVHVINAALTTGEARGDLNLTVIDCEQPLCVTAGLLRPRVILSRPLLHGLSPTELNVVLAHERAHVVRRDALTSYLVRALASLHLPAAAQWLVHEVDIAAEQACDEAAVVSVGDRLTVAAAILGVERMTQRALSFALSPAVVAFGACAVERRVEALLADPLPSRGLRTVVSSFAGAVLCALLISDELHHLTESLLATFTH